MTYRFEYNGNSEYATLHVSAKFVDKYTSTTFVSTTAQKDLDLIALLQSADGVEDGNSISPYHYTVKVGRAFDHDTVLSNVLELAKIWFATEKGISGDWEKLPTLRTDIAMKQCSACEEEQRREMLRAMKDFETLDW